MVSWVEFSRAEPEAAMAVRAAFSADRHALLATLRQGGAPRVSGVEPVFHASDLWLYVMPGSVKSADLRRDPRCALHSATSDRRCGRHNPAGADARAADDAKISGRAVPVTDSAAAAGFLAHLEERTGLPASDAPELWRVDIEEVATLSATADRVVVASWRVGGVLRIRERV